MWTPLVLLGTETQVNEHSYNDDHTQNDRSGTVWLKGWIWKLCGIWRGSGWSGCLLCWRKEDAKQILLEKFRNEKVVRGNFFVANGTVSKRLIYAEMLGSASIKLHVSGKMKSLGHDPSRNALENRMWRITMYGEKRDNCNGRGMNSINVG